MTKSLLVGGVVTSVLQDTIGRERNAAKVVARHVNVSERTAENYLYGRYAPQADQLIRLMAAVPRLRAEINDLVSQIEAEMTRSHAMAARKSCENDARNRGILSAADRMDSRAAAIGWGSGARAGDEATVRRDPIRTATYVGPCRRQQPRGDGIRDSAAVFRNGGALKW